LEMDVLGINVDSSGLYLAERHGERVRERLEHGGL
jgi:hypothetical protein